MTSVQVTTRYHSTVKGRLMTKTPQFYNADGSLTRYGLACGYIDREVKGDNSLELWFEHNCYHVRQHNQVVGRVFWATFDSNQLAQARKRYNQARRAL